MTEMDLYISLRHLVGLYTQIRGLMLRGKSMEEQDEIFVKGTSDSDLIDVLEHKPKTFGASMLKSYREVEAQEADSREKAITQEYEVQRIDVRNAKWKFFKTALVRDQKMLSNLGAAPEKNERASHRKEMNYHSALAEACETAPGLWTLQLISEGL